MQNFFKKIATRLFNTRAAGLYILIFAASIGIATFIENDFGTSAAQKVIFKTKWFELLLILFCVTLVVNIVKFRMVQMKKWALLIFHTSMIVIIIGAGVTRYFGYEGMMHIRESDDSNRFLSADTYLKFEVIQGANKFRFDEPVLFASLGKNKFDESYQIGNDVIAVNVLDFIPNPVQVLETDDQGLPTLKIVIGGVSGREEYFIRPGETRRIRNQLFNFTDRVHPTAINLKYEAGKLFIKSSKTLTQMVMATQQRDSLLPQEDYHPLRLRSLYSDGANSFVFGDFNEKGVVLVESENRKVKNESMSAVLLEVDVNGEKKETYVYGKKGLPGNPAVVRIGNLSMAIAYGAKYVDLPFSIKLYDFIMERYPGTNSAMSYASEVQLLDSRKNIEKDYRIYMNNILTHDGYRFFQSSFDQDEQGTYLSVNHDFWGTWISYLGYALLTIGLIMTFFSSRTRFYQVTQKLKKVKAPMLMLLCLSAGAMSLNAQKVIAVQKQVVGINHAEQFSKVVVQDHKGRMKPIHTLTREVMRKMARKESLEGLTADQIVLSMYVDKPNWVGVPMIKVSEDERLEELLGRTGPLLAYKDFFHQSGEYKIREEVRRAYGLQPIDRGTFEKDIMKIDERVNIAGMIYAGSLFKIIPVPGDPNNTWVSTRISHGGQAQSVPVADRFFSAYPEALRAAMASNNYSLPNQLIAELVKYQNEKGNEVVPSNTTVKTEIALNNLNVFNRLSAFYALLGMVFLALLFLSIFFPDVKFSKVGRVFYWLVIAGFVFHTLGLGMRWYVSGRAPWSNGYESMIYIAWTSTLAGIIFTRKSFGGLAATMILAGTILLVAMLSYLDPEITPLVPVLRSYWLTIHVSLIAGSYGFLMLGAIIGLINLILMVFLSEKNKTRAKTKIQEMTYISELTLMGGLVMISIGTYLGGVWANESWGRYWGWDAKETWALVTILVYAFILHMRIIPKIYTLYNYNLATLFGFASVVMTYFGVNYYLSGLHSYAAGDPIPIPNWVYIAVVSVAIISVLAFWRKKKVQF